MKKKLLFSSTILTNLFLNHPPLFAADGDIVGSIRAPQTIVSAPSDFGPFISVIIRFVIVVAGIYALWQFISGGLGYITSGGDKGKIKESQDKITMSVLGLVIIAVSFILISLLGQLIFKTNLLNPTIQTL